MASTVLSRGELTRAFCTSCVLLQSLSICKTEHTLFSTWIYLWLFLLGIDLNPDSIKDLRDLIKDSILVDWKYKFKFIFFQ